MVAAAIRHARNLEALGRAVGVDAAHEVAVELGRLRSRLEAHQAATREATAAADAELEGLDRRLGVLEARLAELDTRFTTPVPARAGTIPVERT